MKKNRFKFTMLACMTFLTFGLVGLTGCTASQVASATVTLSSSRLTMQVGEQTKLTARVSPKSYLASEAYWVSTNETVALVDQGYVFAIGEGECDIHVFIGGGKASCAVTVEGIGGGETPSGQPVLRLTSTSQEISTGGSFTLKYYAYPSNTTVTWQSGDTNIASVSQNADGSALVTGVAHGTTTVTAFGSNSLTAACTVVVNDGSEVVPPGPGEGEDLGYTGNIVVGAPLLQQDFINDLLTNPQYGFNAVTNSTVKFSIVTWEEDKAAENMGTPKDGPDVYPYASDQTLRLYARKALGVLPSDNVKWIKSEMVSEAIDYATLKGVNKVVGYPFTSDNGYVMFYDKSLITDPSQLETVDALFARAEALGYDVDLDIPNSGFYSAGLLMSYAAKANESLYTLTAKEGGAYSSKANFNSENGLKAARMISSLFTQSQLMGAAQTPGSTNQVLATITDCSKIEAFKKVLGDNYGAAPLPKVSDTDDTRLGVYLGYKFYGVNPAKGDANHIAVSHAVAKFLASQTAQEKRFEKYYSKPTLKSLQNDERVLAEEHIKALNTQLADNGVTPLTAVAVELWAQCSEAVKSIKAYKGNATDEQLQKILETLDTNLYKK